MTSDQLDFQLDEIFNEFVITEMLRPERECASAKC